MTWLRPVSHALSSRWLSISPLHATTTPVSRIDDRLAGPDSSPRIASRVAPIAPSPLGAWRCISSGPRCLRRSSEAAARRRNAAPPASLRREGRRRHRRFRTSATLYTHVIHGFAARRACRLRVPDRGLAGRRPGRDPKMIARLTRRRLASWRFRWRSPSFPRLRAPACS